eukprot:jgi/Mesvir1/29491/Mv14031-RA.2
MYQGDPSVLNCEDLSVSNVGARRASTCIVCGAVTLSIFTYCCMPSWLPPKCLSCACVTSSVRHAPPLAAAPILLPVFMISGPVWDGLNNRLGGVLSLTMSSERLKTFLEGLDVVRNFDAKVFFTYGPELYLLATSSGNVVVLPGPNDPPTARPSLLRATDSNDTVVRASARYFNRTYFQTPPQGLVDALVDLGSAGRYYLNISPLRYQGVSLAVFVALRRSQIRGDVDHSRHAALGVTVGVSLGVMFVGAVLLVAFTIAIQQRFKRNKRELEDASREKQGLLGRISSLELDLEAKLHQNLHSIDMGTPLMKLSAVIHDLRPGVPIPERVVQHLRRLVRSHDLYKPQFISEVEADGTRQRLSSAPGLQSEISRWLFATVSSATSGGTVARSSVVKNARPSLDLPDLSVADTQGVLVDHLRDAIERHRRELLALGSGGAHVAEAPAGADGRLTDGRFSDGKGTVTGNWGMREGGNQEPPGKGDVFLRGPCAEGDLAGSITVRIEGGETEETRSVALLVTGGAEGTPGGSPPRMGGLNGGHAPTSSLLDILPDSTLHLLAHATASVGPRLWVEGTSLRKSISSLTASPSAVTPSGSPADDGGSQTTRLGRRTGNGTATNARTSTSSGSVGHVTSVGSGANGGLGSGVVPVAGSGGLGSGVMDGSGSGRHDSGGVAASGSGGPGMGPGTAPTVSSSTCPTTSSRSIRSNGEDEVNATHLVTMVLRRLGSWDFDALALASVSGGHPVLLVGYTLFQNTGLMDAFCVPKAPLLRFLLQVEGNMLPNPYHNATHVADVTASVFYLLSEAGVAEYLEPVDYLALMVAALMHDYRHPGYSNDFLRKSRGELARIYNNHSILENFHVSEAFRLIENKDGSCNFLTAISGEHYEQFRDTVVDLVLATDLKCHFAILEAFRGRISEDKPWSQEDSEDRALLMKMVIKAADLGHAAKRSDTHLAWVDRVVSEFFVQGDLERERGLPVSPFMDRNNTNVPMAQVSFFHFVVKPMFDLFAKAFPKSSYLAKQVASNSRYWSGGTLQSPG